MIKRALPIILVIWVFITVVPVAAQYADVTTAWPYGIVIWVAGKPDDAATITNECVTTTNDVFTFWEMPTPVPGPSWERAVQTSSESPPMPDASSYRMLQPSWNGRKVLPLAIAFFPNAEIMHVDWDDFIFAGQFDYPGSSENKGKPAPDITLTSPPWDYPPGYWLLCNRAYDLISIAREPNWQNVLRHELGHWLFTMWCQKRGIDIDSFPKLVREGFADYTRHSLSDDSGRWKKIAAIWAQSGGLMNVPPSLAYDVGTSLIAYLVARDGKPGFLYKLPQLATDWKAQAAALTPGWRKWLSTVSVSAGDRAMYEARLERLYLCALLLKPVLPQRAWDLVHRVDAGAGTMDDIDQFWKIVRTELIAPRIDGWSDLIHREDSLLLVGIKDGDDDATISYLQDLVLKLKSAWYHWDKYRPLYITGIIGSIARWGHVPKEEK